MPIRFQGNCPSAVLKTAKYHIKIHGGPKIAIPYDAAEGEQWMLSSKQHPALIQMVGAVRADLNEQVGGAFYINEYSQVLVPDRREKVYYLAGVYSEPLRFVFDDGSRMVTISGEAIDRDGNPIAKLAIWPGLRQGIPYVLAAGGQDIYYRYAPRPDVERTVMLSKSVGEAAAGKIAARVKQVKGVQGGRFYINEWREMFAPRTEDAVCYYVGRLELDDPWFPKPNA
jgi:hypothetical protein